MANPNASAELSGILALPAPERFAPLTALARNLTRGEAGADLIAAAAVDLLAQAEGTGRERCDLGEALAALGDPRLRLPDAPDYWVQVDTEDGPIAVGRFPVTNAEWRHFIAEGGYDERKWWSDDGWAWKSACQDLWPTQASAPDAAPYVADNQPVIGVSFWEAEAYARAHGARLPRFDERVYVARGAKKRPYPWGSPFGEGNANTREEALGRPCAVGLFLGDRTPEGVSDLAGNVAEWAEDGVADQRFYAPGAFNQPSMAAWAKAREIAPPDFRTEALGFRLARDLS